MWLLPMVFNIGFVCCVVGLCCSIFTRLAYVSYDWVCVLCSYNYVHNFYMVVDLSYVADPMTYI